MAMPTQPKAIYIAVPLIVFMVVMAMPKNCLVNCEMPSYSPTRVAPANVSAQLTSPPLEALGIWEPVTMPRGSVYYAAGFSSPDKGWAFGGYDPAYWNGQVWVEYQSLDELHNVRSVKFLSGDDGWAVGSHGEILHWDGDQWTRMLAPTSQGDILVGVDFASPDLGWAVGVTGIAQPSTLRGVMLEWNGTAWARLENLATKYSLFAIDILSSTEGWVVGSSTELLHRNGQQWELYENSAPPGLVFYSIAILTPDDAWMVGETEANEGTIWHWDGRQWAEFQRTRLPLFSVSLVDSDFGWAVGGHGLWQKIEDGSLLMHWNGQKWTEYPISTTVPLRYVLAQNTTDGWIFGGGPTDVIQGEYPGIAFRYRLPTVTPTTLVTPSIVATNAPVATHTVMPAVHSSSTPRGAATSTLIPSKVENSALRNVLPWIASTFVLALLGAVTIIVVRRRRH